jgi:hypothetical protein
LHIRISFHKRLKPVLRFEHLSLRGIERHEASSHNAPSVLVFFFTIKQVIEICSHVSSVEISHTNMQDPGGELVTIVVRQRKDIGCQTHGLSNSLVKIEPPLL